ncbi:MAG: beta-galactosidase, partial [Clostridia bacterium]|nr:beta-galactosidase [Clostridia bacterium]
MRKIRRAMHFDFHTSPGISDLFANFNAENFADKLKQNHVEYINFTARCNMGYSYYNTKIGKKYNGLTRDILKEVLDACHKRDIGV